MHIFESMVPFRYLLITTTLLSSLFFSDLKATHLLGGEITWSCIPSGTNKGKFIFHMKLYRACNGLNLGTSHSINNSLYASFGGPSTIPCLLISQKDLSPPCFDSSSTMNCYGSFQQKINAIEENVYKSAPIQINGIPSISGSNFYFTICCRPLTQYMANINGTDYWLRAVMFPYTPAGSSQALSLGSTTEGPTCYDNSPEFAARPATVVCARRSNAYGHRSFDIEMDSLTYEWANPMMSSTNSVQWKPLYSTNLQLPTNWHNINNVNPSLDPNTGLITFTTFSPIGGYHSTCVKVTSYKENQKVAETYRDIVVSILDCNDTIYSNPQSLNQKPSIKYKETGSSGVFTSGFNKTISIGYKLELDIQATDFDSLNTLPLSAQSPSIEVFGLAMSHKPNDSSDCRLPPCAYLDSINNNSWVPLDKLFRDSATVTAKFSWTPTCNQFQRNGAYFGESSSRSFLFMVRSSDNWCPIPAEHVSFFTIIVQDTSAINWPLIKLDAKDLGVLVNWKKYSGARFNSYELYRRYTASSPYQHVTSINSKNVKSFRDVSANKDSTSVRYWLKINSGKVCENGSDVQTIHLSSSEVQREIKLDWNEPYFHPPFTTGTYKIYKADSLSQWSLLDSTNFGIEYYLDPNTAYNRYVKYRIENNDNYGLKGISNVDSFRIDSLLGPPPVSGVDEKRKELFRAIPNPFYNQLTITNSSKVLEDQDLIIYNIAGKVVMSFRLTGKETRLSMNNIEPGIYFIRYTNKQGNLESIRLVKTN